LAYVQPIYSKNNVRKAGDILKDDNASKSDKIWGNEVLGNWRAIHSYPINTFQATLRDKLKIIDESSLVAQRLKRSPSIISKLKRFPSMQLSRMQDIGGLRAVLSTLENVEELQKSYKVSTRFPHELVNEKNYILEPKDTGYRGIHLIYKYKNQKNNIYDGLHIELQIRTRLQHSWATAVETMGTFLNHSLKSSEGPEEWLAFFALTGSAFAHFEKSNPVTQYAHMSKDETYTTMIYEASRLNVVERLKAFSIATESITTGKSLGSYHIVILNPKEKNVIVESFSKRRIDEANLRYSYYENQINEGNQLQVVLVATGSIESLRQAYPSYFLDTEQFIKAINRIKEEVNKI
jgi:ppGpp synthetase/RelA/SpoT-type nucleotidyltranferase